MSLKRRLQSHAYGLIVAKPRVYDYPLFWNMAVKQTLTGKSQRFSCSSFFIVYLYREEKRREEKRRENFTENGAAVNEIQKGQFNQI